MKRVYRLMLLLTAGLVLTACQSKHEQLQKQIEQRKAALKHKQDSTIEASQAAIEKLDEELQQVKAEYELRKKEAERAHEAGTGTKEMFERVNQLRQLRDSLQVQFDTECAKIRFVNRVRR